MTAASLPCHEPGLEDLLVLAAFLLALNLVNAVLDRTLYCALVGQVFVGRAVVQLGYLGLVLLVFEGGASSSLPTMRANLALASGLALTGVAAPMGLSFLLGPIAGASPLQAFAAGAALCSTSIGTTFTVLSTSGLASTRLGSVLSTAAMMDDMVGLVMVQIMSAGLGGGGGETGDIAPAIVVRPVLVSIAFAVVIPLACRFVLRPLMAYVWRKKAVSAVNRSEQEQSPILSRVIQAGQSAFLVQTGVLLGLVAAAGYAGASVLLAAYLAGIVASWWRDERAALLASSAGSQSPTGSAAPATESSNIIRDMYSTYYGDSVERILKPFFFASIGFSIPISRMFSGPVVWRGIIYAILMVLAKTLCGVWLVRFPVSARSLFGDMRSSIFRTARILIQSVKPGELVHQRQQKQDEGGKSRVKEDQEPSVEPTMPGGQANEGSHQHTAAAATPRPAPQAKKSSRQPRKPPSLYPAGIVSCAMVARGEIGFLISSVAETKGIFRSSSSPTNASSTPGGEEEASELFLIITWAIVLCTILGPLCVGLLVRRVKRLEGRHGAPGQVGGDSKNVLGVWGVT
ncbi:sodium hydrogen exchanger [Apiospora saccharicola]|uniref:Sodium hydrogen exchanger n=1 Tax=Apiospora saccharicola TaxID=335842 RepID=A0ABR1W2Z1_9PEZI